MPNAIKYSAGATPSGAIRKGGVGLGVSGSFGPTNTTAWYNGITPQSGKYIIYDVESIAGIPLIYAPQNLDELTRLALYFGASSGDIVSETTILQFFATKAGLLVSNFDYENIVTDGLTTNLDARFVGSYPNAGTTWYDLSGNNNNASLAIGSPTFTTFDGKRTILFANQNKFVYSPPYDGFTLSTNPGISESGTSFTFEAWFYQLSGGSQTVILANAGGCDGYRWGPQGASAYWLFGNSDCSQYNEGGIANSTTMVGRWVQMIGIFDRANTLGGGTKFYHYINGTLEGSNAIFTPTIQLSSPGIKACCGAFDGYLSVVRVYNRALTQPEITQNFNAQKTYFGL